MNEADLVSSVSSDELNDFEIDVSEEVQETMEEFERQRRRERRLEKLCVIAEKVGRFLLASVREGISQMGNSSSSSSSSSSGGSVWTSGSGQTHKPGSWGSGRHR